MFGDDIHLTPEGKQKAGLQDLCPSLLEAYQLLPGPPEGCRVPSNSITFKTTLESNFCIMPGLYKWLLATLD